jgi:hypothetical protein
MVKLQIPKPAPKEAVEEIAVRARSSPQALKHDTLATTYGTTESRALPKTCMNRSFPPLEVVF